MSFETQQMGDATLYRADALEVLPTLGEVDCVVTDPVWPNVPANSVAGSENPWLLWHKACFFMPKHKRIIIVMRCDSDPRFLCSVPASKPFLRSMQLPYVIPGYLGRILGGDETAYWFGDPIIRQLGRIVIPGRAPAAQPNARPANGHPMSRVQKHFDWLLNWASDDAETVLDPFMGSGTTGVACAKLGRKFIGIEIEPKYFDIACKRIEQAYAQPDLFIEPPAKPEQMVMEA